MNKRTDNTMCEDTNRVIRRRKSKDSQYNGQKCEDTNRVIRSCKSKDSQYNDQKCEDTKGKSEAVNQRTVNTMATRYK